VACWGMGTEREKQLGVCAESGPGTTVLAQDRRAWTTNNKPGAACARLEQWGQSVEHYRRAIWPEPGNSTARMNLALAGSREEGSRTAVWR
jgi:Flp pilus assembly protein TadD